MASPFDRLMTTIHPHLPGAIDNAIKQELFSVCQTFFEDSNAWREDIDLTLAANVTEAEIMPYTGRIKRLLYVTNSDGFPVTGVIMPDTEAGLIQFPSSTGAGNYVATVALTVSDPASRDAFPIVPQPLVSKYWQVLMWGILSNMMVQPSKPYINLSLAQYYASKFRGGIARARNAENAGNTKNSQTWAYPQSFNRRK